MATPAVAALLIVLVLEAGDCGATRRWRGNYRNMHINTAKTFRQALANPRVSDVGLRSALDRLASWHERRARELRWVGSSSIAFEATRDALEMPLPGDFEVRYWMSGSSNY